MELRYRRFQSFNVRVRIVTAGSPRVEQLVSNGDDEVQAFVLSVVTVVDAVVGGNCGRTVSLVIPGLYFGRVTAAFFAFGSHLAGQVVAEPLDWWDTPFRWDTLWLLRRRWRCLRHRCASARLLSARSDARALVLG